MRLYWIILKAAGRLHLNRQVGFFFYKEPKQKDWFLLFQQCSIKLLKIKEMHQTLKEKEKSAMGTGVFRTHY